MTERDRGRPHRLPRPKQPPRRTDPVVAELARLHGYLKWRCPECGGSGYVPVGAELNVLDEWRPCDDSGCHGTGWLWLGPESELLLNDEQLRRTLDGSSLLEG